MRTTWVLLALGLLVVSGLAFTAAVLVLTGGLVVLAARLLEPPGGPVSSREGAPRGGPAAR